MSKKQVGSAKKVHWTQRPENAEKVKAIAASRGRKRRRVKVVKEEASHLSKAMDQALDPKEPIAMRMQRLGASIRRKELMEELHALDRMFPRKGKGK